MDNHYQDPRLVSVYDALNASRADFDFYIDQLPNPPCDVLDIGCGTGTFALELATRGYRVTGVDPASEMIAAAQNKRGAKQVNWVTGFVSDVASDRSFDAAVMTGHAFQCLLHDDDIETLFRAVAARLRRDGSFWFETRNPAVKPWTKWNQDVAGPPVSLPNGKRVRVTRRVIDVANGYVSFEETYHISDQATPSMSQSRLRFPSLPETTNLAHRCDLSVQQVFGDWQGAEFTGESPEIILQLTRSV